MGRPPGIKNGVLAGGEGSLGFWARSPSVPGPNPCSGHPDLGGGRRRGVDRKIAPSDR